jgi:hypothetical protein
VAGSQLTLDQALARVVDQYNMLRYLFEVNPDHVLELPADKVLLDILKAAQRHVPKNDPVTETLGLFILEAQNRTPVFRVSQLLPFIMALQGALQDKLPNAILAGSGGRIRAKVTSRRGLHRIACNHLLRYRNTAPNGGTSAEMNRTTTPWTRRRREWRSRGGFPRMSGNLSFQQRTVSDFTRGGAW